MLDGSHLNGWSPNYNNYGKHGYISFMRIGFLIFFLTHKLNSYLSWCPAEHEASCMICTRSCRFKVMFVVFV